MPGSRPIISVMSWRVRAATAEDADAVAAVAAAGWRDTYLGLLQPETIEAFLDRAYSRDRLHTRITSHHFYVAEGPQGIVAFADAAEEPDRLTLAAIYAFPQLRGQGAGTALLDALTTRFPDLPVAADVLVGNRKGEVFYERRGFEPRETIEGSLFGEDVVERRWWRAPARGGV